MVAGYVLLGLVATVVLVLVVLVLARSSPASAFFPRVSICNLSRVKQKTRFFFFLFFFLHFWRQYKRKEPANRRFFVDWLFIEQ